MKTQDRAAVKGEFVGAFYVTALVVRVLYFVLSIVFVLVCIYYTSIGLICFVVCFVPKDSPGAS